MAYVAGAASALHNGRTWKRLVRIEKACRLTISGQFSDTDIARHIGITPAFFSLLKQTPEFKTRMLELRTGVISQHNSDVAEDVDFQRQQMRAMVPQALLKLQEMMLSSNQAIAFKATQEVLDREGTHAKVSRSSIDFHSDIDHAQTDKTANEIFAILRGTSPAHAPVAAPPAESQNMSAVVEEFTKGATDANSQARIMAETVTEKTLEDIDASRLGRPQ